MTNELILKGYDGTIVLNERGIVIKKGGLKGLVMTGSVRGDKTIFYSNIAAVHLRKAGLTAGYLQITVKGGSESKQGLFQSTKDGDTIHFYHLSNKRMVEGKEAIEARMWEASSGNNVSSMDELEKLSALLEKGIVSQSEFDAKKKKLLNI